MSAEIQRDVYDDYRQARQVIEREINNCIGKKDYGKGLKKWAYIAIIRARDSDDYDEVAEYSKNKGIVEFRLKLNHDAFLKGTPTDRVRLLSDSLIRSLEMMPEIGVVGVDLTKLRKDVSHCISKVVDNIGE